jgi:hypothetical protein
MSTVTLQIRGVDVAVTRSASQEILRNPEKERLLLECATSFRAFLNHWEFLNSETGKRTILGDDLWTGQERFIAAASEYDWLMSLKARKLGLTSLACAFDGWVMRFTPESRVHAISYRQQASNAIRKQVLEGLSALPSWLALPVRSTQTSVTLEGGGHLEAFPASERTGVDQSATHTHLDELARMIAPADTWQAVMPSAAGSLHCLTTSLGPEGFAAELWRRSELGDTRLYPLFIGALERPGRDERWYTQMQKDLGTGRARLEYPLTAEDALAGTGDRFFSTESIDRATQDAYPLRPYTSPEKRPRRYRDMRPRYVAGVDIGVTDAFCLIVLDTTEPVWDVAHFVHKTGLTYPGMCAEIEQVYRTYPGIKITVESNNAGGAVIQNLRIPVRDFWTSAKSKNEILYELQARLESEELKIDPACERIYYELRTYAIPDKNIPQDAVMALAIACHAAITHKPGRAAVIQV